MKPKVKMKKNATRCAAALIALFMMLRIVPSGAADLTVSPPELEIYLFSDVRQNDWFFDYVSSLTLKGAIGGYPDGTFKPSANITCAEYTKILLSALGYEIFSDNDLTLIPAPPPDDIYISPADDPLSGGGDSSEHWAKAYIDTAFREGIIDSGDTLFSPDVPIVRSLMVKMLISALKIEPVLLSSADKPFADVSDEYADAAWLNYLVGGYIEDGVRIFGGERHSTRAEAAAVIMRACNFSDDPVSFKESEMLKFISAAPLNSKIELINYFCYLNINFASSVTLRTRYSYEEWTEIYQAAAYLYPEYIMSKGYDCVYYKNSSYFNIDFLYETDIPSMLTISAEADKAAQALADAVILLSGDVFERIKMVHDYIIDNCTYDYRNYISGSVPFEAYTAYGALINGSALCQGYSAAFNLVCAKLGIPSYGVVGISPSSPDFHMWNAVFLDGTIYFIDLTYDDPYSSDGYQTIEYTSFMLTMQQFADMGYTWDPDGVSEAYFSLIY